MNGSAECPTTENGRSQRRDRGTAPTPAAAWAADQVKTLGFPIVVCGVMFYLQHDQTRWLREKFTELVENNTAAMRALIDQHHAP